MWWCSAKGECLGDERSGLDPCFFFIETISIAGQKFSKCLKNGSDRLRKGNLSRRGCGVHFCYVFI